MKNNILIKHKDAPNIFWRREKGIPIFDENDYDNYVWNRTLFHLNPGYVFPNENDNSALNLKHNNYFLKEYPYHIVAP